MTKFTILAVLSVFFILSFGGCVAIEKKESEDTVKQELEKTISQLDDAWNRGDAIAFSQLWIDDATNVSPMGEIDDGREALEKNMAIQFSGDMQGTTHKLTIERVYSVSSSVALVDGIAEVAMDNYEPWKSKFTAIFLKVKNNEWKIAHMRAYIFLN
jgi:uncharacterized protein (TIGR02246 family)